MHFKKTEAYHPCCTLKNACQACLLDLGYDLPIQVCDAGQPSGDDMPTQVSTKNTTNRKWKEKFLSLMEHGQLACRGRPYLLETCSLNWSRSYPIAKGISATFAPSGWKDSMREGSVHTGTRSQQIQVTSVPIRSQKWMTVTTWNGEGPRQQGRKKKGKMNHRF